MTNNNHHYHLFGANRTAFLVMGCIEASWAPASAASVEKAKRRFETFLKS